MQFSQADLIQLVERSSTIFERLKGGFLPDDSPASQKLAQTRLENWCQVVVRGDRQRFAQRLAMDGLDSDRVLPYLGMVHLQDPENLPGWTATLHQVVRLAAQQVIEDERSNDQNEDASSTQYPCPFEELYLLFIQVARARLNRQAGDLHSILAPTAHAALEESLLRYLSHIASSILEIEFSVFRAVQQQMQQSFSGFRMFGSLPGCTSRKLYLSFIKKMLQGGFKQFLQEYPVLARLMATVTDYWVDAQLELLQRLAADWGTIQEVFANCPIDRDLQSLSVAEKLQYSMLGQVKMIQPDLSDRHRCGRSVLVLYFDCGLKLVYKPKTLDLESSYFQFTTWLNKKFQEAGEFTDLHFKSLKVLSRAHYGWVEYVEHLPCSDEAAARRYYQRAGMLLCLIYVLEGTDYHHENLIASGEFPMPIDQETLMHHRARIFGENGDDLSLQDSADLRIRNSVLRTSFLPYWTFGPDGECFDVSALSGTPGQETSFILPTWQNVNTDSMRLAYERANTRPHGNAVFLDDKQLVPNDYQAELVDGFQRLYRFLMQQRECLLAPDSPLHHFSHQWVRFIFRHTRIYFVLQQHSLQSRYLKDGVERSIQLDLLTRGLLELGNPQLFWKLLEVEHEEMARLDVPMLMLRSDSAGMHLPSGEVLKDSFCEPSYDRVIERLNTLDEADLQTQTNFIKGSLYVRVSRPEGETGSADGNSPELSRIAPLAPEMLVWQAVDIARDLSRKAILIDDGSASWIALVYMPDVNRSQLQQMPLRLYDGTLGIALFLAAIVKVLRQAPHPEVDATEVDQFQALALAAIQPLRREVDAALLQDLMQDVGIGGAMGVGSILYTIIRMSQFLEKPSLLEDAKRIANLITTDLIAADQKLDVMLGAAGLILALLNLHTLWPDESLLTKAIACGHHLLDRRVDTKTGHRAWPHLNGEPLTGFSHGAAGYAYALLKLYEATGIAEFQAAALEAQAYEANVFVSEEGNWPDFRPPVPDPPVCGCAWCHGAPGIGLARLGGLSILDTEAVRQDISVAIQTSRKQPLYAIDHLCCGNLGRVDLLLTAAQVLNQPSLLEKAATQTAQIVVRAQQQGGFGLGNDGPYIIGFFQGSAGIGYELLRVAYPDRLPSVLIWE